MNNKSVAAILGIVAVLMAVGFVLYSQNPSMFGSSNSGNQNRSQVSSSNSASSHSATVSESLSKAKSVLRTITNNYQSPVNLKDLMVNGVKGKQSIHTAELVKDEGGVYCVARYKLPSVGGDFDPTRANYSDSIVYIKGSYGESDLDSLARLIGIGGAPKKYDDSLNNKGPHYDSGSIEIKLRKSTTSLGYQSSGNLCIWFKRGRP